MNQNPIYTIGCDGRAMGDFIATLHAQNITFLIDVRPRSHAVVNPAFAQRPLTQELNKNGIRYVFMGDALGGNANDSAYQKAITRLHSAHKQGLSVVLLGGDVEPPNCHRSRLIGETLSADGIPIAHIGTDGGLLTQAEARARWDTQPPQLQPPELVEGRGGGDPDRSDFDRLNLRLLDDDDFLDMDNMPPPPDFPDFDDELVYDGYVPEEEGAYEPPASPFAGMTPIAAHTGAMDVKAAGALLKTIFGYDEFRNLQPQVIQNVLNKQDSLAIMPTGSGKSICYQLPALMFDGLTVVVSPLISLMEDQVAQLRELGITAVYLNSTLHPSQQDQITADVRAGKIKLLYAAPETLMRPQTVRLLEQSNVDCLTIDEAHCISEWGHDFRREYRQLVELRRRLPDAICLAVTATATDRVRQDIKHALAIPNAGEFIASFDRPNLFLAVEPKTAGLRQTLTFLDAHREQAGIIYCSTRKQVDKLTSDLSANGWPVLPYHAGMDARTRQENQRRFTREEAVVMVATVAFGMGIDKSNVRFVIHYDLPKNLEGYYQQIGRAGRDGLPSDCLLLFSYRDVSTITYFINQEPPDQQAGARARLDAMLRFVETAVCRRTPLLDYFGETYTHENCKTCDNCTAEKVELSDITIPAQKFLSCVKRTGEFYGASHIADVLRGSRAKKVLQKGHDRLSTYNIGGEFSKQEWAHLSRQFVQGGLLIKDPKYGGLKLTDKGRAVFKGEKVMGILPREERKTAVSHTAIAHDTTLFSLLRDKRSVLARAGNVPPYVIFSDRSLVEMAAYFPQSRQTFGAMVGVGQAKLEKYADEFLPIIQAYCQENGIAEKPKGAPSPVRRIIRSAGGRPAEVATMFNNGRSISEIAADFEVKERTVWGHLLKAAWAGLSLDADRILQLSALPPDVQQQVLAAFAEDETGFLRPVYEAMGETVDWDDLRVLQLYTAVNGEGDETTHQQS